MIVRDDLGAEVTLRSAPSRVVCLVPSLTEAIETTTPGALIGVTDYCTHPSTLDVTRIGGSKYPKVDEILALRPDLVVGNAEENRPSDVHELRSAGIPVWVTEAAATVPAALGSLHRLFREVFGVSAPDWLSAARETWAEPGRQWATAVIPVWRRPWVVLGRDTFAGDVLRRLGVANHYAGHAERYPRPPIEQLRAALHTADLLVLPDEPYEFSATDGPEEFPGTPYALLSGRHLTWYGPSLAEARERLSQELAAVLR